MSDCNVIRIDKKEEYFKLHAKIQGVFGQQYPSVCPAKFDDITQCVNEIIIQSGHKMG